MTKIILIYLIVLAVSAFFFIFNSLSALGFTGVLFGGSAVGLAGALSLISKKY